MAPFVAWMLAWEARALRTRLARLRPFALIESMLPAAALLPQAQVAIERHLALGRHDLERAIRGFMTWLRTGARMESAEAAQRRFTQLRLRFNVALTQFDLFSDVLTQRSESESGVWLSGLDAAATDALTLTGRWYVVPPVVCYLDRGAGAAIRRARTRLPGGGENPLAVIRVPRERMVGSGIASSLVHEVGHQGAALLDLVASLRPTLQALQRDPDPAQREVWQLWERWISEIVADFWAVARVGVASTLGLIAVVSLPRAFVLRIDIGDPHPSPWIRVLLSCTIGNTLYPHPQWDRIAAMWASFYPLQGIDAARRDLLDRLRATMGTFVSLLANHRPRSLRGRSMREVLAGAERTPHALGAQFRAWHGDPGALYRAPPSIVFAAFGQARMDGRLSPEDESALLAKLLSHWALAGSLRGAARCAALPRT
ncbi:MAG: hypothetical protein KF788_15465 [Piscinibacter sp.]|nr:hypothetical protein [Piscinibacter sp.]